MSDMSKADRDAQRLERAREAVRGVVDMLTQFTGSTSWQVIVEGKLPPDAELILEADDIYNLYDRLQSASEAITCAIGIGPFEIVATGVIGEGGRVDPDSVMPTSLLPEAEEILRRAAEDDEA